MLCDCRGRSQQESTRSRKGKAGGVSRLPESLSMSEGTKGGDCGKRACFET